MKKLNELTLDENPVSVHEVRSTRAKLLTRVRRAGIDTRIIGFTLSFVSLFYPLQRYRERLVDRLRGLHHLDLLRVSSEERRAAIQSVRLGCLCVHSFLTLVALGLFGLPPL
jgi:hypothetical protein